MLFNSLQFLIFFPIVVILYYLLKPSVRWVLLLAASYYFYMAWKPEYIVLIVISTLVDYFCSYKMGEIAEKRQRIPFLVISLVVNLGLLFFYKYTNFFISISNDLSGLFGGQGSVKYLNLILPMGISFYTFQTMSYSIDVYHNPQLREKHLGIFALFVTFFPQLVAGPIERASHLINQLKTPKSFSYQNVSSGLKLMAWGMFKKVVIADRLGSFVDTVYNHPTQYSSVTLVVASIFFAFQIYCDFSGYSDIAIGAARVMGYSLMLNFSIPYFSISVSEFWRRWHISLSTWFRDYVYIPLGGNRVSKSRLYFNLMVTFIVSGFWHGANWTFIVWGAIHGLFLVIEVIVKKYSFKNTPKGIEYNISKSRQYFGVLYTLVIVLIGWIFFRANSVGAAAFIFNKIGTSILSFTLPSISALRSELYAADMGLAQLGLAALFITFLMFAELYNNKEGISKKLATFASPIRYTAYASFVAVILLFGEFNNSQFIYFQF